ncbi:MAG: hypothetical protein M0R21_10720 [Lentimicrobiaceae bacterium]|nr:hypothetical protein [Lentimicrobiaceae bacterium]
MQLLYSQPQPVGGSTPLYNGNISAMQWINNHSTDAYAYNFTYDDANRLNSALFAQKSSGGSWTYDNSFSEQLTYDANGNILTLNRYADNEVKIDQLNFHYLSGEASNQISYITDAMGDVANVTDYAGSTSTQQGYFYDANGNMTSDADKNITAISYNYLNKPELIDLTSGNKIQYTYDATGAKLAKKVLAGSAVTGGTYYLGNFVYNQNGVLQYILTSEGRLVPTGNTYRYEYFMKDHLGNTRATYAAAAPGLPQVMEYQHYYPFGMQLEALGYTSGADLKNNYLYNGKELQEDYNLNWYDYGARMYDPVIGRWSTVDPINEKHYDWTGYTYTYNNPIKFIDVLGLDTFNININNRQINCIEVKDSKSHTFVVSNDGKQVQTYTLGINEKGLVKFPDSGEGFGRYGKEDEGGDHYLNPETAAATFGLVTEMKETSNSGFKIDFGDMSNENGGAPGGDHKMHGGENGYSGDCIDFRYLNEDYQSFQGKVTNSNFSAESNHSFLETAGKWGFTKNYVSNMDVWKVGNIPLIVNGKKIGGHNDHGHLTFIKKK